MAGRERRPSAAWADTPGNTGSPEEPKEVAALGGVSLEAAVRGLRWLTDQSATAQGKSEVKRAFELELGLDVGRMNKHPDGSGEDELPHFWPGDALGVLAPNSEADVGEVMQRLRRSEESKSERDVGSSVGAAAAAAGDEWMVTITSSWRQQRRRTPLGSEASSGSESGRSENSTPRSTPGSAAARRRAAAQRRRRIQSPDSGVDSPGAATLLSHLPPDGTTLAVADLLRWWVDIRAPPKKRVLRALSARCADEREKRVLESWSDPRDAEGAATYRELCVVSGWPTLPQLLCRFPSCQPTVQDVCTLYPALAPRYYSATSCCTCQPGASECRLTIALNLAPFATLWTVAEASKVALNCAADVTVDDPPPSAIREGLCSAFLLAAGENEADGPPLRVFFKRRKLPFAFTFPPRRTAIEPEFPSPPRPFVAFGAGTGVAPFRSLFRHAAKIRRSGQSVRSLFFAGSRNSADALMQDDFEQLAELCGYEYVRVFSRVEPTKVYVQHVAASERYAPQIANGLAHAVRCSLRGLTPDSPLSERDAPVFLICGDAKGLFLGISSTLARLVPDELIPDGGDVVKLLTAHGWLISDIW
jgi:sulfite reductase alpha subunit-like flavoprotein